MKKKLQLLFSVVSAVQAAFYLFQRLEEVVDLAKAKKKTSKKTAPKY